MARVPVDELEDAVCARKGLEGLAVELREAREPQTDLRAPITDVIIALSDSAAPEREADYLDRM